MITITQVALTEIAANTAVNAHCENLEIIATLLNLKNLTATFKAINARHLEIGYLDQDLHERREAKRIVLMDHCRERVANFKELYNAL